MTELNKTNNQNSLPPDSQRLFGFAKLLMGALNTDRLAKLRQKHPDSSPADLVSLFLDHLSLRVEHNTADLAFIPAEGPLIVVANHPTGGIDGLLLIKVLSQVRPDVKVLADFATPSVQAVDDFFITRDKGAFNASTVAAVPEAAADHLKGGGALVIFPAGSISTYNIKARSAKDRQWGRHIIEFIRSAEAPVVPVFIRGSNKVLLHLLHTVNPLIFGEFFPVNFFGKKEKEVIVRTGKPIRVKELAEFEDDFELGRYLRAKTYMLGSPIKVKPFFRPLLFKKRWEDVVLPRDAGAIAEECARLRAAGNMLHETGSFEVYRAHPDDIPNTLYEIGRLRELTFREVGEGTGKNIDLDEYDLYYRHLFIWDRDAKKLVGAYRLGLGKEILQRYGKRGFYLHSLFKMRPAFDATLSESIELGRSFVTKEYQLKPLSLFLLWKGILYFILKHPEYRYLIGPVSISGEFSKVSKYLIISFIKAYYYDSEMAEMVTPRNEYIPEINVGDPDVDAIRKMASEDIKKLDKAISEIELGNMRLPALLKKYLGQNAKIIAFNVDPAFNNALDGLLVLDLFNIPKETLLGLAKEFGDKSLLEKLGGASEGSPAV